MYANESLLKEMHQKRSLKSREPIAAALKSMYDRRNHAESLQHSVRLSRPTADVFSDIPDSEKEQILEDSKMILANISEAWQYGLANYSFPFKEEFIKRLAYLIEPSVHTGDSAEYRTMGVRPGLDAKVTPPYPAKIPLEMKRFLESASRLEDHCTLMWEHDCSVDISSWAHLHLTRIHPFEDGNGRLGRMLGNLVLIENSYPPLVVQEGERVTYNTLLENAILGFNDREKKQVYTRGELSDGERILYDYFAGKINASLDRMI